MTADSPSGDGARRSGRTRRPASTGSEDFVDPGEVARSEWQATGERNGERRVTRQTNGQTRRAWLFFSAHRRAADSATCLAVSIFILELVAPPLERASGIVAVLESKTHGSGCLIVFDYFYCLIHEAV